ncbi:MAG: zinc-binding dehydrogenase [Candidatus Poribacteria bacterium]
MKGVVFLGGRECCVKDFPEPTPGMGEVLVRMKATGICGSDLHVYRADKEAIKRRGGRIPGHEPSGIVEQVGEGVNNVKVGDRVSVNHYRGCGHCKYCATGNLMWCGQARGYGGPIDGSHADFVIADERNCVLLPDEVSFIDGAFIACPGGTAYSAMRKLDVSSHDTVAIFGLGPVGLSGVIVAKAMGGKVIGVDIVDERVNLAQRLGADAVVNAQKEDAIATIRSVSDGEGADLAFEASGSGEGRSNAVACLKRGGKVVFCGAGSNEKVINPGELIGKQLTLMGSFVLSLGLAWDLAHFTARRKLPFENAVTHRFSIEDAPEAYRLADEGRTGKVVFVWD